MKGSGKRGAYASKGAPCGRKGGPSQREYDDDYGDMSWMSKGGGNIGKGSGGKLGGKEVQAGGEVVHHFPPKEMIQESWAPEARGGQTLLIAYFPWEASEADIEREFSKFCRVKRVHLVVDKSSRKPRCFGFVKFISKSDAEEALRATTEGLVQLPDTRGHVWHLKAEWTKSGDMVVDDSDAEQEVAKRKEERRHLTGGRDGPDYSGMPVSRSGKGGHLSDDSKWPTVPPKGALHPGVPAPLPPLQTRYGQPLAPHQHGAPSALGHQGLIMPQQAHLPQPVYGGMQQSYGSLPHGHIYGAPPAAAPPPPLYQGAGHLSREARDSLGRVDAMSLDVGYAAAASAVAGLQAAYGGTQGYAAAASAAAAAAHAPGAYGAPPSYAHAYGASQSPYVSSHQAYAAQTQAAYGAGQPSPWAASVAAPPPYPGQQPYAAAAAQAAAQAAAAAASYGTPPGYPPQAQYAQPASNYASAGQHSTAYATASYGLSAQSAQPGAYGYLQQQQPQQPGGASQQASGVMAYSNFSNPLLSSAQHLLPSVEKSVQEQVAVAALPHHSGMHMTQTAPAHSHVHAATITMPSQSHSMAPGMSVGHPQPIDSAVVTSANGSAAADSTQYLDHIWQSGLPAPPAQQPPAPPVGHGQSSQWHATQPEAAGQATAVWNSFDDAAAKGMVDGLVGDDGARA